MKAITYAQGGLLDLDVAFPDLLTQRVLRHLRTLSIPDGGHLQSLSLVNCSRERFDRILNRVSRTPLYPVDAMFTNAYRGVWTSVRIHCSTCDSRIGEQFIYRVNYRPSKLSKSALAESATPLTAPY